MICKAIGIAALTIVLCGAAQAQTRNEGWVGVWQANAFGQPTGTLTLADDTGELGGTLILDIISDEGGRRT